MNRTASVLVTLLGIALFAGWIWSGVGAQTRSKCEVCLAFEGARVCREALGPDRDQAARAAQRTACGLLTQGVTQAFACDRTVPESVRCEER